MDQAFDRVIKSCADLRKNNEGTWLGKEMISAYEKLHKMGYAHSVEAWKDGKLVGGLYGISLGGCFFLENPCFRPWVTAQKRPLQPWIITL